MSSLEISGLDELLARMEEVAKSFPELKGEALQAIGDSIQRDLHAEIDTGIDDSRGHVKGWQRVYLGSKKGYVAVRPAGSKDGGGTGRDSAGAITRYLNRGHAIAGTSRRVEGRYFYSNTKLKATLEVKRRAKAEGERLLREAAERIAGKRGD